MLIISQNATDYDLNFPKDAILRINLAWCNSLDELEIILKKIAIMEFLLIYQLGDLNHQIIDIL